MGVFQMGCVWTVRLKSAAAKDQLLKPGKFQVMSAWCVPLDPERRDVRIKLQRVSLDISNVPHKKTLGEYVAVRERNLEKWSTEWFEGVDTTTCVARLTLKEGTSLERRPHQLRVSGGAVLVVVSGSGKTPGRGKRKNTRPRWNKRRVF